MNRKKFFAVRFQAVCECSRWVPAAASDAFPSRSAPRSGGKVDVYSESTLLLGKASQSWEYTVSDKIVYAFDICQRKGNSGLGLPKNYLRSHLWLQVLISTEADYIVAIIRRLPSFSQKILGGDAQKRGMNKSTHAPHENLTMLLDPIDLVKLPDGMSGDWRPAQSVVWLKRFDVLDSLRRYCENLLVPTLDGSLRGRDLFEYGELGLTGFSQLSLASQRPNCVIQGSPEALENIGRDQENPDMRLFDLNLVSDSVPFQFLVGRDGVGVLGLKTGDFSLKLSEVNLCPLGLPPSMS